MWPKITLDHKSHIPLYIQIKQQIQEMIYQGLMQEGEALQSTRKLADSLNVNRRTTIAAYEALKEESIVEARIGQGTIVKKIKTNDDELFHLRKLMWTDRFNYGIKPTTQSKSMLLNALALQKGAEYIAFATGVPDPDIFPVKEFKRILIKLMDKEGRDIFQYTPGEGIYQLREYIADMMLAKGKIVKPTEVMISAGALQGLNLIVKVLIKPGDIIVVESPTALGSIQVFKRAGARIAQIPMDAMGMKADILERFLSFQQAKLIYTIPTFQNPSGAVMSLERRKKLLDLCKKYKVPVVEDDPFSDLYYDREPPPSLKSLDNYNYVIYLSSYTKTMFPGLRVGWIVAPSQVINRLAEERQFLDLNTNTISQYAVYEFCKSGIMQSHLENLRRHYSHRRDVMLSNLKEFCYSFMSWNKPEGGIFIWAKLRKNISSTTLLNECYREKVSFVSGENFFPDGKGDKWLRLNFSYESENKIKEGIRRLSKALKRLSSQNKHIPQPIG